MNDAAKQLVIINEQKEKILDKLHKQETSKDSEVSACTTSKEKKVALIKHYYGYTQYTGLTGFREWCLCPCDVHAIYITLN